MLFCTIAATLPMIAMPMIAIREMMPVSVLETRAPMKRHQHPLHAVVTRRVNMRAYSRCDREHASEFERIDGLPIGMC